VPIGQRSVRGVVSSCVCLGRERHSWDVWDWMAQCWIVQATIASAPSNDYRLLYSSSRCWRLKELKGFTDIVADEHQIFMFSVPYSFASFFTLSSLEIFVLFEFLENVVVLDFLRGVDIEKEPLTKIYLGYLGRRISSHFI